MFISPCPTNEITGSSFHRRGVGTKCTVARSFQAFRERKAISLKTRSKISSLSSIPTNISENIGVPSNSMLLSINAADNVLSNQDLLDGSLLAIILAFLFSFLQGRTPSSSNVKLWPEDRTQNEIGIIKNSERIIDKNAVDDTSGGSVSNDSGDTKGENGVNAENEPMVFDELRDMSKPENYLEYTSQLRREKQMKQQIGPGTDYTGKASRKENRLVLFAFLVLFVPIFSVEFFFALSRQFICGDFVTEVDDSMWLTDSNKAISAMNGFSPWATQLCSPHLDQ